MVELTIIKNGLIPGFHMTLPIIMQRIIYYSLAATLIFWMAVVHHKWQKKHITRKVSDLKTAIPQKAHGIIFGRSGNKVVYSPTNDEGHLGIFSGSGTGKTAAVGIPTLRSWNGTVYVIDISGDIEKNCPGIGNKLIYAPDEKNKYVYNPFASIDSLTTAEERHEALEELVFFLMPEMAGMSDTGEFFLLNGRKILTAAIIKGYDEGRDFVEICRGFVGMGYPELFDSIDVSGNQAAIAYINSFHRASEQNTAGCKQAADAAVKLFAVNHNMVTLKRPGEGEIEIEPRLLETHNIFIRIPDMKLELYAPLLNLITCQMMQYISSRKVTSHSKTILLFMDEFASLRISGETIIAALRKYRKRRCRIMIMTQNLADLDILYGHDMTRAMMSNLHYKLLLGGLAEPESQSYFAELIGYQKTKSYSRSANNRSVTTTETENREYVIDPADLDRQGRDAVILIHRDGKGYMLLEKNYYFKSY